MSEEEIASCPRCGKEGKLGFVRERGRHYVMCITCGIKGKSRTDYMKATDSWNKRRFANYYYYEKPEETTRRTPETSERER